MNRREFVTGSAAVVAAPLPKKKEAAGFIALNEDNSHYFFDSSRGGKRVDRAALDAWLDQYAGTQVRELMLCINAMRVNYASRVWDPIWRGYDPKGPDDQPLFASLKPESRAGARRWVHTAWQLDQDGIDPYAHWIARARKKGISPWISSRMNDLHEVNDDRCYMHSEFWREHPEFRRVPYRQDGWDKRALDFGRAEVREHHMKLIRELAERYDFDGLELDWMRFGYHFRPGHEAEGGELLTQFMRDVRALLRGWEKKRGHRIQLGARVPSRPWTAVNLGMDGVRWAREGLVDMLVPTPFWATMEFDIPIEEWKRQLRGLPVTLAAGLELLIRPYPNYRKVYVRNSIETVRGAASAMLDRGADRVYLFNYMSSDTTQQDTENYHSMLCEIGTLATMSGKPRRHILTYSDTWAPGEPEFRNGLPAECRPGDWRAFRLPTGPKPGAGNARIVFGISDADAQSIAGWEVRLNGTQATFAGDPKLKLSIPECPLFAFEIPVAGVNRGYNTIEVKPTSGGTIHWVEMNFQG